MTKEVNASELALVSQQRSQTSVDTTEIKILSTFQTSNLGDDVQIFRGCFTPTSKLLLTSLSGNLIFTCNFNGNNQRSVKLDSSPNRVSLYDSNTVLLSTGDDFIQKINLSDLTLNGKITVVRKTEGIYCRNGRIWVRSDIKTFTMMDIYGQVHNKIATTFDIWDISVHQSGDVYYTDWNDSVFAVTQEGKERKVHAGPDLRGAVGIAIDNRGYIYVTGHDSNNIQRISPDGKDHTVILTEEDGIKGPTGLAFNEDTNELMVINDYMRSIFIYKI